MEQITLKDKELLLKDLCARLPYGVKVQDEIGRVNKLVIGNADLVRLYYNDFSLYNQMSLPYLRPMSSMTEEETEIFNSDFGGITDGYNSIEIKRIDWLNSHHFDYRGLIERGLALEVTEENNPYEN